VRWQLRLDPSLRHAGTGGVKSRIGFVLGLVADVFFGESADGGKQNVSSGDVLL